MFRKLTVAAAFLLANFPAVAPLRADEAGEARLRLADATELAGRAQRKAADMGLNIAVAIVNREGRVVLAHRMDEASFLNLSLAEDKAVTAAMLSGPSSDLAKGVDGGMPSLLSVRGVIAMGGGMPILRGGRAIGGLGISGGSPEQDEQIARAALKSGAVKSH